MSKIIDALTNASEIEAVGAEPARFLSRLAETDVSFWNVEGADECSVVFRVDRRSEKQVLALAPRCCCEARVRARYGPAQSFARLRRRRLLLWLPLLLFALLVWSSFFVWRIDVSGNKDVPTAAILNALEDSGVAIGAYWPAFHSDVVRAGVLAELPQLKWLSVSVRGSCARVEVRETTKAPPVFNEKQPVKLVAALPGYIEEMAVCRGCAKFEKGQAALTGETLADGAVPDTRGGVRLVHARGEVIAETYRELTAALPLTVYEKTPAGRPHTRLALLFGGKRINFYADSRIFDGNCDTIIKVHKLGAEGLFELPVALVTETRQPYALTEQKFSETEAKARLQKQLEDELRRRVGDGKIENAAYSFAVVRGSAVGTLRARCRENIAREQPMTAGEIAAAQSAAKSREEKKTE